MRSIILLLLAATYAFAIPSQRDALLSAKREAQNAYTAAQRTKDKAQFIAAAGGIPGEVAKGWRVKAPNTFDLEFGFSCMGYEIAAGWGCAMAQSGPGGVGGTPIVMLGDGTYMMMNSDIYSTVLSGHKMIVIVCDNGGYAVISRLQQFKGVPGFNNLLKDCRIKDKDNPVHVDFAKHAEAMGAAARACESLADLEAALEWAKGTDRTDNVIGIPTGRGVCISSSQGVIVADNENKRNTFKLGATYALAQLFIGFSGVYSESFGSHSLHK
mgnify:CR=1 FL=1